MLQPNDPYSYYKSRELVPHDVLGDLDRAKIVITNYHSFKLKERIELSSGGRALLQGRGEELNTLETEGQMLQRVMPDLRWPSNGGFRRGQDYTACAWVCSASYWSGVRYPSVWWRRTGL